MDNDAVACRYHCRDFTVGEMDLLRELIASPEGYTSQRLSIEFCRHTNWRKPDGGLKDIMARITFLAMHLEGLIELPSSRHRAAGPK